MAKVLVVGAGAIGAFYGGVLARAGCEVSVVARSDYDAVASRGYRIDSRLGELSFRPAALLRHAQGQPDYLVVALKNVEGVNRPELIRGAVADTTTIVLVQNGVGIEEEVAQAFPRNELLSAVAYAALSREGPAHVKHHSDYTRLFLGLYPRGTSARARALQALLQRGGITCTLTGEIVGARWQKSAWNAVFNPLSAIGGGLGTREILATEAGIAFARAAIGEVAAIAAADGHSLPADTAERTIEGTLRMANYVSSMGQDRLVGRPMETEAVLGNVVRRARQLGVAAPRLESLYALLVMAASHPLGRADAA